MRHRTIKNLFAEYKGISIVITAITALSVLGILSYIFWDQTIFAWQRQNLLNFKKPLLVKGLVQLGKAWLLIWLLLCWVLLTKCRKKAMIALIALLLLVFTVLPLKIITQRPRPRDVIKNYIPLDNRAVFSHSWSFPSGDTASAFAVAIAIAPFISLSLRSMVIFLAGCVGVLRIVSFSHYLSDVLAGAVVGILAGFIAHQLIKSRLFLRKDLIKFLNPGIVLAGIIIIPSLIAISDGIDDLFIFSIFYPPLVVALFLLSKVQGECPQQKLDN